MAGSHTASSDRLVNGLRLVALLLLVTLGAALWQARRAVPPVVGEVILPVPEAATSRSSRAVRSMTADVREAPAETQPMLASRPPAGPTDQPIDDPTAMATLASPPSQPIPSPLWTRKPEGAAASGNGSPTKVEGQPSAGNASPTSTPSAIATRPLPVPTDEISQSPTSSPPGAATSEGPEALPWVAARPTIPTVGAAPSNAGAAPPANVAPAGATGPMPTTAPPTVPPAAKIAADPAPASAVVKAPAEPTPSSPTTGTGTSTTSPDRTETAEAAPTNPRDALREGVLAYQAGEFQRALELWRPLAGRGVVRAQFHLGAMYYEGRTGAPDRVEAYVWLNRSASGGYQPAEALRDRVFSEMTAAEKDEVRQRAAARG